MWFLKATVQNICHHQSISRNMDVLDISLDDNEADTSQDELDEEIEKEYCYEEIKTQFLDWERPEIPEGALLYSSSVLQEQPEPFQFFMIDSISTATVVKHPGISLDSHVNHLPLHNVIRLFGVSKVPKVSILTDSFLDGVDASEEETFSASVCCNVHGFVPYFYALPSGKAAEDMKYWVSSKSDEFIDFLSEKIKIEVLQDISCTDYHEIVRNHKSIIRLEPLYTSDVREEIYQFVEPSSKRLSNTVVLKIYCSLSRFVWKAHKVLDSLVYNGFKFQCFETHINNNIRFLTDQNLPGCSWLELEPGKYFQRNGSLLRFEESPKKESYCQIEIDVHADNITRLPDQHERYQSNPAIRILSFDIEVMVSPNDLKSPKDGHRQVIQIGNVLGNYYGGTSTESVIGKTVFVVGTCDTIPDAKVVQFYIKENVNSTDEEYLKDAEAAMLGAWRDFVVRMDPDIIIGYNIKKFDIPYLIDRAYVLNNKKSSQLPFLGRMKKVRSQIRPVDNYLKKVHPYDENNVDIQGRIILDLYPILVRHDRINSGKGYFKLSNVAKRYLAKEEEKQDVNYKEIEGLQRGTSVTRNRLAHYCLQDSMIPFLLLYEPVPCRTENIGFIELYIGKSHAGGNILRYLLNKSMSYNDYFKQIRLQKNPGKVVYTPDTPSPKKFFSNRNATRNCAKNLFTSGTNNQDVTSTSSSYKY